MSFLRTKATSSWGSGKDRTSAWHQAATSRRVFCGLPAALGTPKRSMAPSLERNPYFLLESYNTQGLAPSFCLQCRVSRGKTSWVGRILHRHSVLAPGLNDHCLSHFCFSRPTRSAQGNNRALRPERFPGFPTAFRLQIIFIYAKMVGNRAGCSLRKAK